MVSFKLLTILSNAWPSTRNIKEIGDLAKCCDKTILNFWTQEQQEKNSYAQLRKKVWEQVKLSEGESNE